MSSPLSDDEQFVVELASSLVVLVARWRERAAALPATWPVPDSSGGMRQAYMTAADELEAALRAAALDPGDKT